MTASEIKNMIMDRYNKRFDEWLAEASKNDDINIVKMNQLYGECTALSDLIQEIFKAEIG